MKSKGEKMKGSMLLGMLIMLLFGAIISSEKIKYSLQEEPIWKNKKEIVVEKVLSIGSDNLDEPNYFLGFITDITVDNDDNLYILDYRNGKANKYAPDGKFIISYGNGIGQGPGEFQHAADICVDSQGHVYISDSDQRKICVFNSSGKFLRNFLTEKIAPLYDMLVYRDRRLIFGVDARISGGWQKGFYQIYSIPEGKFFGTIGDALTKENAEIHIGGNSICIDKKNGNILISYAIPYLIEIYSGNLSLVRRFGRKAPFFEKRSKNIYNNILSCGSSYQIASLPDGKIINLIRERISASGEKSEIKNYLDFFDENGQYLITIPGEKFKINEKDDFRSITSDNKGYIWAIFEDPYPHISKYRIRFRDIVN